MDIREATSFDLEKIAEVYVKNHTETYKDLLPDEYFRNLTLEHAKNQWAEYLYDADKILWVAYSGEGFLGFAAGEEDKSLAGTWYLASLHITEKARGRGIGTALIKRMMKYAAANSYSSMSVCIIRGNDNAGDLYKKLGAKHLLYFEDDFCGTVSNSEKLIWNNLYDKC